MRDGDYYSYTCWVLGSRHYTVVVSVWGWWGGLWSPGLLFFGNLLIVFHMQASHALQILLAQLAMQIGGRLAAPAEQ